MHEDQSYTYALWWLIPMKLHDTPRRAVRYWYYARRCDGHLSTQYQSQQDRSVGCATTCARIMPDLVKLFLLQDNHACM